MKVVSWNVNGLRACVKKGFLEKLESFDAEVVCLQEVRAFPEQLPDEVRSPRDWHVSFFPAQRPGYSGVAIYSRHEPDEVITSLDDEEYDIEGRFICVRIEDWHIVSGYFPKGNGKNRDNSRVPYKLGFYDRVMQQCQKLGKDAKILVAGDFNTAHHDIDLARPAGNRKSSGFLPIERDELTRWESLGWQDTFRSKHIGLEGAYTWWRQYGGSRENNVGWRIDYIFASPAAASAVVGASIHADITGSDHCPVSCEIR